MEDKALTKVKNLGAGGWGLGAGSQALGAEDFTRLQSLAPVKRP